MIKNIFFDMGNVMIRFDRNIFLEKAGLYGEDRTLLNNEVFLSLEWAMMDRGTLTEEQAAERICARVPQRLHEKVNMLLMRWDRPIIPIPSMAELIRELKQNGYGVFLLSNTSCRMPEYWPGVPGSEYFDGTVISADVKLLKPQPEIYLYALSKFGLRAEDCAFIDDAIINAEGAAYCGMSAIVFHGDAGELRQKLIELGVKISPASSLQDA